MPRDAQIQMRRDTAANWTSTNPTLAAGEIGLETDTNFIKIGDGSTAWTSLLYTNVGLIDSLFHQGATTIDVPARLFSNGSSTPGNGNLRLAFFTSTKSISVSNISMYCITGASDTGGTTTRKLGLFTVNAGSTQVTCVARSANTTTLCSASSTMYTLAFNTTGGFPASYSLIAGTLYAVGSLFYNTGGTFGSPSYLSTTNNGGTGALSTFLPSIVAAATSQTDITSSTVTYATNASGQAPWFRLS